MFIYFLMAHARSAQPVPTPVLWLNLRGEIVVNGRVVSPQVNPGVSKTHIPEGTAFRFSAMKSGILFGDMPALKLADSVTISCWLNPASYVNDGPGAQILFRGDDICGRDPYSLNIQGDGTVNFLIQNADDQGMSIKAEIPLNRWTHVTASFNSDTGDMNMWLNGEKVAFARTSKRMYTELNKAYAPGVGIGNVQNDKGPHNQPFRGMLADLRLYSSVLNPTQVGYGVSLVPYQDPPTELVSVKSKQVFSRNEG